MMIARVEQVEICQSRAMCTRAQDDQTSLGRVDEQCRWMELEESFNLTVSRDVLLKTHPSILVAALWEGEERGICSAALKELVEIIKDQVEERSTVVLVLNKDYGTTLTTCSAEIHRC